MKYIFFQFVCLFFIDMIDNIQCKLINLYFILIHSSQDCEVEDPTDSNGGLQIASPDSADGQKNLLTFWPTVAEEIKNIKNVNISYKLISNINNIKY